MPDVANRNDWLAASVEGARKVFQPYRLRELNGAATSMLGPGSAGIYCFGLSPA
ncbi:MAG: hypothetical protein JWL84_3283 [Rhodospirillales bacterium]|nr:hypothetical protein [Rhodospirillales bacterium]